ncbi:MAG TPA: efflux RND transporter permease subunit [Clostridiaceae bacterium]|nr:efflux RND transporter permease subunit [Clostridiaceae bacterium]
MLSSYSVRRPYTVFVAVILIIVLGVISFVNMTTDLLPSIDMPYIIVITSYPGASPEKVEQTVTRPLEATLGTVSGLKNISSISRENSSIIILEYVQDTNMDSAIIELSSSIDLVSGQLDEGVGTPVFLKINPDMIPVVVASVDRKGMGIEEISDFTSETLIPAFERLEGVASVNASGLIKKRLEVVLDDEKIEELNIQIKSHLEKTFDENRITLEKAQSEIAEGLARLEKEAPNQKSQLAQAGIQLNNAIANINSLLSEETILNAQKTAFQKEKESLQQLAELNDLFKQIFPLGISEISPDMYKAIMQQVADRLPESISNLPQEEMAELAEKAASAPNRIAAIDVEIQNIDIRQMALSAMKPQLENSLKETESAIKELESGRITMAIELANNQIRLENGKKEIEKALEEFNKAKEEAFKNADLSNIITEELVSKIIMAQNFNMPAGYILNGNNQHLVKVGEAFSSREEIQNMVLMNIEPVGDIRLSDVAKVSVTDNSSKIYTKVNGNEGVLLTFQKQSTASTSAVADAINKEIKRLQNEYEGLSIRPLMNQGDYIHMLTDSVIENLLIGGVLAILVLLVFLKDVRPTIEIALSIPISLMFAMALMYFTKITINVISLSGLALGVGMLVDNSIVVIENIYRLRNEGIPASKAAVKGAVEVSGALAASTLTTVCVFLPIVFTQGLTRQLFTDMGLTITYSLLASLIVALTLVPAMGSTLLKSVNERNNRWFDKFARFYERILKATIRRKAIILIPVTLLFILSIYGASIIGTAFLGEVDSPQMSAIITMPKGITIKERYALNDEVMKRILEIEAVETVGAMSGSQSGLGFLGGGSGSDNETTFYILLKDNRSLKNTDVERIIYEKTADLGVEVSVTSSNMDISILGGRGIQVNIKGQNLDKLADISKDIAGLLSSTAGAVNIETGLEYADKETRIQVDKDKAMREGLTVAQIYSEISSALKTETQATILAEGNKNYPVLLVKSDQGGITQENLADYTFTVKQKDGKEKQVRLGDIAQIIEADSLRAIRRENQARYMTVTAEIADGYNIGLVSREFEKKLADYDVPEGYDISISGENKMIKEAMRDLVLMIILAVIFIYLIMVAQFQSLLSPFIILFTMPLAFTGGLLLLWACNMELSVISMLGFLILAGVVVNNGIVFISYVEQLLEEGMNQKEALVKAGVTRLRPILLTALTTILAMVTMALGFGSGAEMVQPLAVVTIGGLTYATVLTLLVVPALYDIFHRKPKGRIEIESENMF